MIQVNLDREKFRLTMTGHAGRGKKGEDLVCAAASILAYTLAENVRALEEKGAVMETSIRLEDGYAEISCTPVKQMRAITELIYLSVCKGFALLEKDYPDGVKFSGAPG